MTKLPSPTRLGLLLARAAVLIGVCVLICVPALTRVGQRLETASHAPSIAKNIDCPPKKVTAVLAPVASPPPMATLEAMPVVAPAPPRDPHTPPTPFLFSPRPLRAPPSAFLV